MKKIIAGILSILFVASASVYANNHSAKKSCADCCKPGAACCSSGAACCK